MPFEIDFLEMLIILRRLSERTRRMFNLIRYEFPGLYCFVGVLEERLVPADSIGSQSGCQRLAGGTSSANHLMSLTASLVFSSCRRALVLGQLQ